jgi:hypothetical protein
MTLQLFHSEFSYIWGKFYFIFYQCSFGPTHPPSITPCAPSPLPTPGTNDCGRKRWTFSWKSQLLIVPYTLRISQNSVSADKQKASMCKIILLASKYISWSRKKFYCMCLRLSSKWAETAKSVLVCYKKAAICIIFTFQIREKREIDDHFTVQYSARNRRYVNGFGIVNII